MSDPRLSSPSTIRLVAASAAAVASLGVVALGVQLGTSGLVGDGPGRNPGSRSATPASATVDLPRARPATTLDQQLIALAPALSASAFGSSAAAASTSPSAAPAPTAAPAPSAPSDGGGAAPAPAPTPVPTPPLPAPVPPPPEAPAPTVPPPADPVVDPIVDVVDDLGVVPPLGDRSQDQPAPTLEDLTRLLLGR